MKQANHEIEKLKRQLTEALERAQRAEVERDEIHAILSHLVETARRFWEDVVSEVSFGKTVSAVAEMLKESEGND